MIPKIIHQFWDGPKQSPAELMDEWKSNYEQAGWQYILWNSSTIMEKFPDGKLANQRQYELMPEWNGKCDIARYEILHYFFALSMIGCLS